MPARSLRRVLAAQWIMFALALAALFIALTVLLLYVLEDSFIDRRLHDTAARVERLDPAPALPERFRIHAEPAMPDDVRARLGNARPGGIAEFRRADGRYVHALWTRTADGVPYALVYDATDDLTVNGALVRGWPHVLALLLALALAAYLLARRFVERVSRRAVSLVEQLRDAPDPAALRAHGDADPILEFGALAHASADAWEARLVALERERTTLAFLAHELRTPLQSARTSIALLDDDRADSRAWERLSRAIDRIARAGDAMLWLASDAPSGRDERVDVGETLADLVAELAPLATARGQSLELRIESWTQWPLRRDGVEVLFANLLLNAIQHGAAGSVTIDVAPAAVTIANARAEAAEPGEHRGFGLGLEIVRRLAARFGLRVLDTTEQAVRRVRVARSSKAFDHGLRGTTTS